MPVWHEKTKAAQQDGSLRLVGLIQEQHPDRCRLFMQWHEMDWPVLSDPLNQLGVNVVPIIVLIDEAGIVQAVRPDDGAVARFLDAPPVDGTPQTPEVASVPAPDRAYLFDRSPQDAITRYEQVLQATPDDAETRFRLGVAHRARFEKTGDPDAFEQAVDAWSSALDQRPNQYIWRRRIQQYGPRLDKPYPFYDWVTRAREAIRARGQTPVELRVEPAGAEIARPAQRLTFGDESNPDPQARILDADGAVHVRPVVVPHTSASDSLRLHLIFDVDGVHWNNEADPMTVWLDELPGWGVEQRRVIHEIPTEAVSHEQRVVEFELRATGESSGAVQTGFALVGICESDDGTCLYRRVPFSVELPKK